METLNLGIVDVNEASSMDGDSLHFEGIEAFDVGSLLDQFEEASQGSTAENERIQPVPIPAKLVDARKENTTKDATNNNGLQALSKSIVANNKAMSKQKSTILLPMGVPSRRGRGQAMAIQSNVTSPKLQKIFKQNLSTRSKPQMINVHTTAERKIGDEKVDTPKVSPNYYSEIIDHNYCQNFPSFIEMDAIGKKYTSDLVKLTAQKNHTMMAMETDILELEDSNSAVFDSNDNVVNRMDSTRRGKAVKHKTKIQFKDYKFRSRNYRKKGENETSISTGLFDKIPSYFTALSAPAKVPKKNKNNKSAEKRSGIKVTDFIERKISPTIAGGSDLYNKLPAYHNCFINSTKYDESSKSSSSLSGKEVEKAKYPWDRMRDGMGDKSSSRSQSPLLMMDSRCESKSREISRSRSRSSSRSRSVERSSLPKSYRRAYSSGSSCGSRSSSRHRSHSRSRSRDRSRRGQRTERRDRGQSYSSYSSCSSDLDWRSSSRSRSRSYPRSHSRSHSRSRSRSYSRSPRHHYRSKHQTRRTSDCFERRWKEREQMREEEKSRQIEERRIVYVGKIPNDFTRKQLRWRFERFGEIEETSVHFREQDDNYGFVTFKYTCDAYAAIENGNKVAGAQPFDMCFGGRREFCSTEYADLDGQAQEDEDFFSHVPEQSASLDFDELLKQAQGFDKNCV